ncbi:MAG: hypothetical protein WC188_12230 [Candidatus Caldatribacteriota bacterium]
MNDKYFFVELDETEELNDIETNEISTKFKRVDRKVEPSFSFADFLSKEDLEKLNSIR